MCYDLGVCCLVGVAEGSEQGLYQAEACQVMKVVRDEQLAAAWRMGFLLSECRLQGRILTGVSCERIGPFGNSLSLFKHLCLFALYAWCTARLCSAGAGTAPLKTWPRVPHLLTTPILYCTALYCPVLSCTEL